MQIIKNDNLVDARFNIVGKKIKKKFDQLRIQE